MADIAGILIKEIVGWQRSSDGQHVLVGVRLEEGGEFALAFPQSAVERAIEALAHATEAFPAPRGPGGSHSHVFESNWFDFGIIPATGQLFVRYRMSSGGHLAFAMDRSMAQQLHETIGVALGTSFESAPAGAAKN